MTLTKSKHGHKCISPCYPAGKFVLHPITLQYVTIHDSPFCLTDKIITKDYMGRDIVAYADGCMNISKTNDIKVDHVVPVMNFSSEYFLREFYNIDTLENAVEWCDRKDLPKNNIIRILNAAWDAYYDGEVIIDSRIVEYHIKIIKLWWLNDLFNEFKNMIKVTDGKIMIGESDVTPDKKIVSKFLIDKFLRPQSINNMLVTVLETNRKNAIERFRDRLFKVIRKKIENVH